VQTNIVRLKFSRTLGLSKENDPPPLHHYEREEVDALRLVQQVVRERGGVVSELEGKRGERNAVALQVPERPACM
jgi:hypothetical protein